MSDMNQTASADPVQATRNVDQQSHTAVAAALTEDMPATEPEGYARPPQEDLQKSVNSIRAHTLYSDTTWNMFEAQRQTLAATANELEREAKELINKLQDAKRALQIVEKNMAELKPE